MRTIQPKFPTRRPSRTQSASAHRIRTRYRAACKRLRPGLDWKHARYLRGNDRGDRSAVDERTKCQRRLAHGGVFDVALLDSDAKGARYLARQTRWPQHRDSTFDWPVPPRSHRLGKAGWADPVGRL